MESSPQVLHERGGQEETPQRQAGPSGVSATLAQEIAELWGEHLDSPEVDPEDDFFALGGNSLAGIKIIERVLQDHGVRLSVRDFYLAGTPTKVAELIEQGRAGA